MSSLTVGPSVSHDYIGAISAKNGGNACLPFSQFHPDAYKQIQMEMVEYAMYVRAQTEKVHYEQTDPNVRNMTVLTDGPGGLPVIPGPKLGVKGMETAENAAIIIRQYFLRHYSKFRCFRHCWFIDCLLQD
jgi:hypothetical protein